MKKIFVNEVVPRDGLQNIDIILNVDERFQLIQSLEKAGIKSLEVGSFVNPTAVPAMDNTDVLLEKLINTNSNYSVLIPNIYGYEQAKNRVFCSSKTRRGERSPTEDSPGAGKTHANLG